MTTVRKILERGNLSPAAQVVLRSMNEDEHIPKASWGMLLRAIQPFERIVLLVFPHMEGDMSLAQVMQGLTLFIPTHPDLMKTMFGHLEDKISFKQLSQILKLPPEVLEMVQKVLVRLEEQLTVGQVQKAITVITSHADAINAVMTKLQEGFNFGEMQAMLELVTEHGPVTEAVANHLTEELPIDSLLRLLGTAIVQEDAVHDVMAHMLGKLSEELMRQLLVAINERAELVRIVMDHVEGAILVERMQGMIRATKDQETEVREVMGLFEEGVRMNAEQANDVFVAIYENSALVLQLIQILDDGVYLTGQQAQAFFSAITTSPQIIGQFLAMLEGRKVDAVQAATVFGSAANPLTPRVLALVPDVRMIPKQMTTVCDAIGHPLMERALAAVMSGVRLDADQATTICDAVVAPLMEGVLNVVQGVKLNAEQATSVFRVVRAPLMKRVLAVMPRVKLNVLQAMTVFGAVALSVEEQVAVAGGGTITFLTDQVLARMPEAQLSADQATTVFGVVRSPMMERVLAIMPRVRLESGQMTTVCKAVASPLMERALAVMPGVCLDAAQATTVCDAVVAPLMERVLGVILEARFNEEQAMTVFGVVRHPLMEDVLDVMPDVRLDAVGAVTVLGAVSLDSTKDLLPLIKGERLDVEQTVTVFGTMSFPFASLLMELIKGEHLSAVQAATTFGAMVKHSSRMGLFLDHSQGLLEVKHLEGVVGMIKSSGEFSRLVDGLLGCINGKLEMPLMLRALTLITKAPDLMKVFLARVQDQTLNAAQIAGTLGKVVSETVEATTMVLTKVPEVSTEHAQQLFGAITPDNSPTVLVMFSRMEQVEAPQELQLIGKITIQNARSLAAVLGHSEQMVAGRMLELIDAVDRTDLENLPRVCECIAQESALQVNDLLSLVQFVTLRAPAVQVFPCLKPEALSVRGVKRVLKWRVDGMEEVLKRLTGLSEEEMEDLHGEMELNKGVLPQLTAVVTVVAKRSLNSEQASFLLREVEKVDPNVVTTVFPKLRPESFAAFETVRDLIDTVRQLNPEVARTVFSSLAADIPCECATQLMPMVKAAHLQAVQLVWSHLVDGVPCAEAEKLLPGMTEAWSHWYKEVFPHLVRGISVEDVMFVILVAGKTDMTALQLVLPHLGNDVAPTQAVTLLSRMTIERLPILKKVFERVSQVEGQHIAAVAMEELIIGLDGVDVTALSTVFDRVQGSIDHKYVVALTTNLRQSSPEAVEAVFRKLKDPSIRVDEGSYLLAQVVPAHELVRCLDQAVLYGQMKELVAPISAHLMYFQPVIARLGKDSLDFNSLRWIVGLMMSKARVVSQLFSCVKPVVFGAEVIEVFRIIEQQEELVARMVQHLPKDPVQFDVQQLWNLLGLISHSPLLAHWLFYVLSGDMTGAQGYKLLLDLGFTTEPVVAEDESQTQSSRVLVDHFLATTSQAVLERFGENSINLEQMKRVQALITSNLQLVHEVFSRVLDEKIDFNSFEQIATLITPEDTVMAVRLNEKVSFNRMVLLLRDTNGAKGSVAGMCSVLRTDVKMTYVQAEEQLALITRQPGLVKRTFSHVGEPGGLDVPQVVEVLRLVERHEATLGVILLHLARKVCSHSTGEICDHKFIDCGHTPGQECSHPAEVLLDFKSIKTLFAFMGTNPEFIVEVFKKMAEDSLLNFDQLNQIVSAIAKGNVQGLRGQPIWQQQRLLSEVMIAIIQGNQVGRYRGADYTLTAGQRYVPPPPPPPVTEEEGTTTVHMRALEQRTSGLALSPSGRAPPSLPPSGAGTYSGKQAGASYVMGGEFAAAAPVSRGPLPPPHSGAWLCQGGSHGQWGSPGRAACPPIPGGMVGSTRESGSWGGGSRKGYTSGDCE